MFDICEATTREHMRAMRTLMRRYIEWQYQRHAQYRDLLDRYFDPASFEAELARLPGEFSGPRGRLLLALANGEPAGCVGLRDLGDGICEMKRMFVAPAAQGLGLGRALVTRLIGEAWTIGYSAMRLDTGPLQHEAHRLYESIGFARVEPYYELDPDMRDWLMFMELDPGRRAATGTPFGAFRAA